MDGNGLDTTPCELEKRNLLCDGLIKQYSHTHGVMDVAIGAVGLIPGAALPALALAIGAQAPVIYQPLVRKIGSVYQAPPQDVACAQIDMLPVMTAATGALDIAADFGVNFIIEMAKEFIAEIGFGAAMGAAIPIVGGIVAAALDWKVGNEMTRCVGRMTSIYYQNGARWSGSKRDTYEAAKNMNGDLNGIRRNMNDVRASLLKGVLAMVQMMRKHMNKAQIREALRSQNVPDDLIDDALATF